MNSIERNQANAHLAGQKALGDPACRIAAGYAARKGRWEAHRDRVFSSLDTKTVDPVETKLTDEQIEIQNILSNY